MAVHELFYDPLGLAYDEGHYIAPIGGHSDHVHVSFADAASAVAIISYAQSQGLRATENPYTSGVTPGVHVGSSYHYRTFADKVNGRPVGMAIDVSGSSSQMAKFALWVKSNYIGGSAPPAPPTGSAAAGSAAPVGAGAAGLGCLVTLAAQLAAVAGTVAAVIAWLG